jgi:predicted TIM-barrel fold metal-dependent hydrolase
VVYPNEALSIDALPDQSSRAGTELRGLPVLLVSGDGHVGLRSELYKSYLDPAERDDFDEFLAHHFFRWTPECADSLLVPSLREQHAGNPRHSADLSGVAADPARRVRELDEDGVAAEILFPDDQNFNTPPWLAGIAPQAFDHVYPDHLRLAGARAYNRWLSEFCSAAPSRLLGQIALGSIDDVEAAVTEVRRAYGSGLTCGVILPLDYDQPLYHHQRYDPLWAVCTELGLAVTVHAGDGGPKWYGDDHRAFLIYMMEQAFFAERPLWSCIYGGVFERHPELRMVFTEQGSSWVPGVLESMDSRAQSPAVKVIGEPLTELPSETFRRHCVVANSLMQRSDIDIRSEVGVGQLAWGSDFPHLEGTWPEVRRSLSDLMNGVPEDEMRAIVGGNLVRAYQLDFAQLGPIADRIGPGCEELIGV